MLIVRLAAEKNVPSGLPCYLGMSAVIFILYGIQVGFGTFLTTFCVLGPLQTTSQVGGLITSIYFSAQGVSSGMCTAKK